MTKLAINTAVRVNPFLTTDPKNKQGEEGTIINVNEEQDIYEVKFSDGIIGLYSMCEGVLETI